MSPSQQSKHRDPTITIASPRTGDTIGQTFTVCGTFDPAGAKAPKITCQILDLNFASIPGEAEFDCTIVDKVAKVWLEKHTTTNVLDGEFLLAARLRNGTGGVIAFTSTRPIFRKTPVAVITAPDAGGTAPAAGILVTVALDAAHSFADVTLQLEKVENGVGTAEGKSKTLVAVDGTGKPLTVVQDTLPSTITGSHFRVTARASDGNPANDVNLSAGELKLT